MPKMGLNGLRLDPKVGSQVWVSRLAPKAGSQGFVQRFGPKAGSYVWIPRLDIDVECVPRLGPGFYTKVGYQGWALRRGPEVGSQGWVIRSGPKYGSRWCVGVSIPIINMTILGQTRLGLTLVVVI